MWSWHWAHRASSARCDVFERTGTIYTNSVDAGAEDGNQAALIGPTRSAPNHDDSLDGGGRTVRDHNICVPANNFITPQSLAPLIDGRILLMDCASKNRVSLAAKLEVQ
mmetsp:Transcript_13415/g.34209  ORF Transcript_13415/g.34209 Transcript_13415/m.34209 type:complete len:109 (+) Transcript_13415:499-825(+)